MNSIWSGAVAVMAYRSSPPRRKSILRTFTSKPSGPHQDSMPSLVVQSDQTSLAAAPAKVRSMLTRRREGWICEGKLGAAPVGLLECCEVELAHVEQGFHNFCRVSRFGVAHHLPQRRGHNLQGNAPAILEPATRTLLSTIREERTDFVDLVLGLARHEPREILRTTSIKYTVVGTYFL